MKMNHFFIELILCAFLVLGCSKKPEPVTDKDGSPTDGPPAKEETVQAKWTEEGGLVLPEPIQKEIQLQTAQVDKQNQKSQQSLELQIFREARERSLPVSDYRQGSAYGTIRVEGKPSFAVGDTVSVEKNGFHGGGSISRILQIPPASSNLCEAIIAIPDPGNQLKLTEFVNAAIKSVVTLSSLTVPESSVLSTTEGTFVYRKEGENFKKVPVELGLGGQGFSVVTKGLNEGDTIVVSPVKTLWLTELQLRNEGSAP